MILRLFGVLALIAGCCAATTNPIPGSPLTVPGTSASGVSFVASGTITQADLLSLDVSGHGCLQQGTVFCTNPAGVVIIAGTSPVGQTLSYTATYGGASRSWTYGALLLTISGVGTIQVFPTNAANGLNSATPPTTFSLAATSFASLGFGNFTVTNPTITLFLADTDYSNNGGSFTVSGTYTTSPAVQTVPALSKSGLMLAAVLLLIAAAFLLRRAPAGSTLS